ncbi:amino acid permease C-terminal domain-containing protein, partial [Enterococcus faecalis]|uniref:amino acid permease C-terminal domain-containing protein n=1 Tax=Enterococcus faecalis TaxID=1351 RepID=UPI003D6C502A
ELTNIVTLFYLMFLALAIIKLRTMKGEPQAGQFKVPLVAVLPLISIVVCAALMCQLSVATWQVFGVGVVIGLAIYFFYG